MYAVNTFYCHLLNEDTAFVQWLNRVNPGWKRYMERVGEIKKMPCSHLQDSDTSAGPAETLPVDHNHVAIHRLRDGLI